MPSVTLKVSPTLLQMAGWKDGCVIKQSSEIFTVYWHKFVFHLCSADTHVYAQHNFSSLIYQTKAKD